MEVELTPQGRLYDSYCDQIQQLRGKVKARRKRGIYTPKDESRLWLAAYIERVKIPSLTRDIQMHGTTVAVNLQGSMIPVSALA